VFGNVFLGVIVGPMGANVRFSDSMTIHLDQNKGAYILALHIQKSKGE